MSVSSASDILHNVPHPQGCKTCQQISQTFQPEVYGENALDAVEHAIKLVVQEKMDILSAMPIVNNFSDNRVMQEFAVRLARADLSEGCSALKMNRVEALIQLLPTPKADLVLFRVALELPTHTVTKTPDYALGKAMAERIQDPSLKQNFTYEIKELIDWNTPYIDLMPDRYSDYF